MVFLASAGAHVGSICITSGRLSEPWNTLSPDLSALLDEPAR